jgi:hypothetical protein
MILLALLTSVNANPNYARCSTPIQPGDSMMRATIQPGAATFTWSRGGKALACNSNYQPGETLTGVLSGPRADTQALWVAEGGATLQFEAGALRGGIPNCETTRVYTLEGWDAGVVSARMPASGGIKLHAIYARGETEVSSVSCALSEPSAVKEPPSPPSPPSLPPAPPSPPSPPSLPRASDSLDSMIWAHGVLMSIGLAFFVPIAIGAPPNTCASARRLTHGCVSRQASPSSFAPGSAPAGTSGTLASSSSRSS